MTKRPILTIVITSIALIVLAGIAWVIINPFSSATRDPALLNSTWGMSPTEVDKALGVQLSKDVSEPFSDILDRPIANRSRFSSFGLSTPQFSLWNYQTTVYFNFFDNKLYQYRVQLTSIDHTDLDSTIVSQLSSKYGHPIDSMKSKPSIDGFLHQSVWNSRLVRVEYWMVRGNEARFDPSTAKPYSPDEDIEALRLRAKAKAKAERERLMSGRAQSDSSRLGRWDKYIVHYEYVARVRLTYLPIEKEINEAADKERKNIF